MRRIHLIADYRHAPTEGTQVIAKSLVDGMRAAGHQVTVLSPDRRLMSLGRLLVSRPECVVFVHGPGAGVVAASAILRRLSRARIIWVSTRPDLRRVPRWMRGRATAHAIVCNRRRSDVAAVAPDALIIEEFIGIDPRPFQSTVSAPSRDHDHGVPLAMHIGHVRKSRGLDLLIAAKRELEDKVRIVVQVSPTFSPDHGIVQELRAAGIELRFGYVDDLGKLYSSCQLYLFPVRPQEAGAVELPLTVLEAVASRCPILTTDFGVVRSALGDIPGVNITTPGRFVDDMKALVEDADRLSIRPPGLPQNLEASRLADVVLQLVRPQAL